MKLEEIDCNEDLWNEITSQLGNGCTGLENECRFAFQTTDPDIDEDDIDSLFWDKYPNADQIEVLEIDIDEELSEYGYRYFGASVIIYASGIKL